MNNEARGGLAVSGGTIDVHKPFSVGRTVTRDSVTVTPEQVEQPVTVTPKALKPVTVTVKPSKLPVTVTVKPSKLPVTVTAGLSGKDRIRKLRQERRARGLVEVSVWVPVDKVDAIRRAAEAMAEGLS